MQLRVLYAHGSTRYQNINAEPLIAANAKLLECAEDGQARAGQERLLAITTPDSYKAHVREVIKGTGDYKHNFIMSQIHIDEFHNTKSDTAATPTIVSQCK